MVPGRLTATSGCVLTRPKLTEQVGVSRQVVCHFFKDNDVQVATPLKIMKVRQLGLLTLPGVFKRMLHCVGKPVNGLMPDLFHAMSAVQQRMAILKTNSR